MEWVLPAVGLLLLVAFAAAVFAAYAVHLAIQTRIEVGALRNATHQIQFVPIDAPDDAMSEKALNQALRKNDMEAFERLSNVDQYDDQEPLM